MLDHGSDTPWGPVQDMKELAEGIVLVDTARHGGFKLSRARRYGMPKALAEIETFTGGNWYEEDLDAIIVVLAFPELFQRVQVFEAYRGLLLLSKVVNNRLASLWDTWTGPARDRVHAIAQGWLREHLGWWRPGSAGTNGEYWWVHFRQLAEDPEEERVAIRHLSHTEYAAMPRIMQELPGQPPPPKPRPHTLTGGPGSGN